MKKMVLVIATLSLLFFSLAVSADANSLPPDQIRGNGGFEFGFLKLDLAELNSALEGIGYSTLDENVILAGGGGMGGTRLGPRLGGYGCGGEVVGENANGDKTVLGMGFGGFVFEHGIFAKGKTDVAIGSMFGGGGVSLELKDKANSELDQKWEKGFIAVQPRITVHQQIAYNMGIELTAAYLLTYDFDSQWTIGNSTFAGPFHNLTGPYAGLRITWGF